MNFPPQLAIRASDPCTALGQLTDCDFVSEPAPLVFDDEPLISSQSVDIESYGIAGRIWEAAYAMCLYLQPPRNWEFEPQFSVSHGQAAIVELGSGNGFLGFRLIRLLSLQPNSLNNAPQSIVLTDLEEVCPLIRRNGHQVIKDLSGVDVLIQPLEWGNLEHGHTLAAALTAGRTVGSPLVSHILCSDLVYFPELFAPLLRTLLQLSSPPFSNAAQPAQVIISWTSPDMIRSLTKEAPFWSAFGAWFDFSPVLVRQKSDPPARWERFGSHKDDTMFIFVATRKPETLRWPLPKDSDLMKGNDEKFETLLFMNITSN